MYQLDSLTGTIKQLICQAEGLRGDAFLNRALLKREREDLSHEMIPVDLRKLMEGSIPDLSLQKMMYSIFRVSENWKRKEHWLSMAMWQIRDIFLC